MNSNRPRVVPGGRPEARSGLLTLLFTDIAGSTSLKQQLGDKAGLRLIQGHHQLLRKTLAQFGGGREINTAGDSFFLAFATPSAAVHFALLLQAKLREFNRENPTPVQDRLGIHLGEVALEDSANKPDLHGLSVDLCARVTGLAQPGQILLTRAVFDNARQSLKGEEIEGVSGLDWMNHGRFELKGVGGPVEVCEVRATGTIALSPPTTSEKAHRVEAAEGEAVLGWRPAVGTAVPNTQWLLEEKLGEGGFGEVWLGRHQVMKERRVFKFCFRADRVRSLKREMTLFRLIKERIGDHPNIVALREVYFEQPPYYVEEEYVAGQDLASWCAARGGAEKVPLETKLEIVAQIADALQAAHDAGVIHRDVKPANILISNPKSEIKDSQLSTLHSLPVAKLTDFGIGQVVSAEALSGVTKAGFTQTMLGAESPSQTGTQLYMAPELLAGHPATTRSDIYSLGVVLYQILVGDFKRPVTTDWARNVPDSLLREDLQQCFAGDPGDRFTGAGQLAKHLRTYAQRTSELQRARADAAERERLKQQADRRHKVALGSSVATVILMVIAAALVYGLRRAQKAEGQAIAERERERRLAYSADMNLAQQALSINNLGRAGQLLNRNRPKGGEKDLRGWEWRYLWQQSRSDALFALCQRSNSIWSLAVSSRGRWLAVGEDGGGLSVWDLGSRQEVARLAAGNGLVRVAFSPREPLLAFSIVGPFGSPNSRYAVRLWDCADKKIVSEIPLGGECMGLAFTENGQTLVSYTGNPENRVALWRVPAGTSLASYPVSPFDNLSGTAGTPFAVARQGNVVAVAPDNTVHLIDLSTGKERWAKTAAEEWVKALALSSDGSLLASGAGFTESAIRLWDTATGREITRLQGHRAWVAALVFWPDGKTLASASGDQTIRLWDLSDLASVPPPRTLRGHNLEVWRLALLPDGRTLASGCKDGSVYLWDTTSIQHERSRIILPERVAAWRLEPDGLSVLTVDLQGRLTRWKGTDFRESESLLDLRTRLTSAGWWALRYSVVFSRSGRQVAVGSTNGVIKVWDVQQRRLRREFPVSSGRATPLEFFAQGNRLAVFCQSDRSIHDWDLTTGIEASPWPRTVNGPFVTFSQDGQWSLALNSEGTSVLREMTDGRETNQRLDFRGINDVAFTPDAHLFSAASHLGYAKLWDRATFRELAVFRGFLMGVHSVAFSPDGRRIAFGSDGTEALKLWDVESRQELLTLEGQGSLFRPTAFSADGNVLGSCNVQGWLHLWRAPSWDEIEATEKSERGTKESSKRRRTTD